MKKICIPVLLITVLLFSESFIGNSTSKTSSGKNSPILNLTVDRAPFEPTPSNSCTGQLTNNARTASITFLGNPVIDYAGHVYPTKFQLTYTVRGEALGDVNVENVSYEYNNEKYNFLPGTAYVSITKIKWADDKKSFVMNADIFCKMKKNYVMEEFVPVLVIRGSVQNLTVAAPVS